MGYHRLNECQRGYVKFITILGRLNIHDKEAIRAFDNAVNVWREETHCWKIAGGLIHKRKSKCSGKPYDNSLTSYPAARLSDIAKHAITVVRST